MTCLLRVHPALAACDNFAPISGATATCDASAPNPSTASVAAVGGSTNVSVFVLSGAGLNVQNGSGIVVRDSSTVTNLGTVQISGDYFDGITSEGNVGGFGHNTLTNGGSIHTLGAQSEGIYNGAAAVRMVNAVGGVIGTGGAGSAAMLDFSTAGGGTLINHGALTTSGDGSYGMAAETIGDTIINTGTIITTGAGSYGLYANANAGAGASGTTLTNQGSIDTYGLNGHGIVSLDALPGPITNTGVIAAHGTDGLGAFFAQRVTFVNAAGARLTSDRSNAIDANGGGSITNAGTISGGNAGISVASGDAVIVNSGVIEGGANLAISSTGPYAVTITNTGQIAGGGGVAVWTDSGVNTFNMDGGTVTGLIHQGTGINTFVMQAGQVDSVDQGGPQPRFTLIGGRVIGTLTNGGTVTISGGRIGGVAMSAARNTFAMSGGVIDTNVTAGSGNTSLAISGGSIGGAVTLGDGANSVTVSGGSIAHGLASGDGPTTFRWLDAGVIGGAVSFGAGGTVATLSNLKDANLAGVSTFDGGGAHDVLTFDHTDATGLSRFVNWERINAINASRLTLDARGLTVGDDGSHTGVLDIDSSSALAWNGGAESAIMAALSGTSVTMNNAGTIDLTGGAGVRSTLVIRGDYVGNGGRLLLQSELGGDGSPSGKLVISQGAATGATAIRVTNAGGAGALTVADGIMVVQTVQGATTAASAFSLSSPVKAGAFTYFLYRGGFVAGTADNWYLRSSIVPTPPTPPVPPVPPVPPAPPVTPTPPAPPTTPAPPPTSPATPVPPPSPPNVGEATPLYRIEVPLYAEIPSITRDLVIEEMGTFHDRHGDQSQLNETGALRASWSRVWGNHTSVSSNTGVDSHFSGTTGGVQIGQDLYADTSAAGHRNHYGFLLGAARASGDVSGFALGMPSVQAGSLAVNSGSAGAYWTHIGPGGWYTDAVVMGSALTIKSSSNDGIGATTHGRSIAGSIEGGVPFALPAGLSSVSIEPQAQVIWQHVGIDNLNDGISSVAFNNPSSVAARLGLRLTSRMEGGGAIWQPYLRANLWRYFNAASHVTFGDITVIPAATSSTIADFSVGATVNMSTRGSLFANVHYAINVSDAHRATVGGNAGVRWRW